MSGLGAALFWVLLGSVAGYRPDRKYRVQRVVAADRVSVGQLTRRQVSSSARNQDWAWTAIWEAGNLGDSRPDEVTFNGKARRARMGIIKRSCTGCADSHKEVYFRWKQSLDSFDAYQTLLVTWRDDNFHTDFDIYSTLDDATANTNAWTSCNADDAGIGFPRDCGPSAAVGGQWTSLTRGGQADYAFYVHEQERWEWLPIWEAGTYGSYQPAEATFDARFRATRMGIVKRLCEDCADSHQEIYYRQKSDMASFEAYQVLLVTWRDSNFHTDFDIYSSLDDAIADTKALASRATADQALPSEASGRASQEVGKRTLRTT
eukprot:TRINITY_DN4275_c0_g1_i6.p1 TRINITY_DN4275_c0_g1~~TRINITY_DN4275_c0_g1_i6.p1  ORF type:complete len:319 (+),score=63.51 TRINITY_DN4275_c0_g1_i6:57-1013(+)